jgi:hypothetical protein
VFINEKILKRLMMASYKRNGVYMAREEGWIYLSDAFFTSWEARIAVGCVPKTILGAMVECAGAIPEDCTGWTADKEKNQMEAFLKWGLDEKTLQGDTGYSRAEITPLYISSPGGTLYRILQLDNNSTLAVHPEYLNAVDPGCIDKENGEGMIRGPYYDGEKGIFAFTDHAVWHVTAGNPPQTDHIMNVLSDHRLRFDEKDETK